MNAKWLYWWLVKIGSRNIWVPSITKPQCEVMISRAPFQYPIRRLIVKSRKVWQRELNYNCTIALIFDMYIGTTAADVRLKFQKDVIISINNLSAPRLHEILRWDVLSDIETGLRFCDTIWLCTTFLICMHWNDLILVPILQSHLYMWSCFLARVKNCATTAVQRTMHI